MTNPWTFAALWVGLALVATLLAIWFKGSTALAEIVVLEPTISAHWANDSCKLKCLEE